MKPGCWSPLDDDVVKGDFLEAVAPPYANLTLLLEIAMGVGLLIGALFARRRRFRAACLVPVRDRAPQRCLDRAHDDSFISCLCKSGDTAQTWQSLLRTGDRTRRARKRNRNRGIVHPLAAGTDVLPEKFRITKYKLWMRTVSVLWWLVLLLGLANYLRWYVPHLF
jgi:hypothetical protein